MQNCRRSIWIPNLKEIGSFISNWISEIVQWIMFPEECKTLDLHVNAAAPIYQLQHSHPHNAAIDETQIILKPRIKCKQRDDQS